MKMKHRAPWIMAPFFLFLALQAGAETVLVRIEQYSYRPASVHIKPGDTVRWVNDEKRTSHSVRFPAESLSESERFFPGEHWERSFRQPGSYPYECGPHPEMKGVVIVAE